MDTPLVIDPQLDQAEPSVQGQRFVVMLDGTVVPGLPFCQVAIPMEPGKVTIPHIHDEIHVAVILASCDPTGVLTLYGDRFEHVRWLHAGQELYIPPGVKHMAIRPRTVTTGRYVDHRAYQVDAVAYETRGCADPRHDVRALPQDWPHVVRSLVDLGLGDLVTWPDDALAVWPEDVPVPAGLALPSRA